MFRHAYTLLLMAALFWAGNAIAGKLAIGHISPMLLNSARWVVAIAVMSAIGWTHFRRDWPVIKENWLFLFALGAVGFSLFNIVLYNAVMYTTVINTSIEQAAMPMFIFALNFMLYRMGVSWGQIIGFLMSVLGVAVTVSHGNLGTLAQLEMNIGDALMLVAVISYAGYTVALTRKPVMHWKSFMLTMCLAAFLFSLPFTAWEAANGTLILPDAQGWGVLAYTAIFPSLLSQFSYMRGVELIGANRASLFINMIPVFGTALSVVLIGEAFQFYHAVALVLVFGGIWLAEQSGRRRAAAE